MAFMSFEAFLYARTNLHFLRLDELSQEKRGKYHKYTLGGEFKGKKLNFKCTALGKNLFDKNDEIILTNLKDNIILFRNFSKNLDNFKEAKLRHIVFTLLLFCASSVFMAFCFINNFQIIDISFFALFFIGFIGALINYKLLIKQIKILQSKSKDEIIEFLSKRA